MSTIEELTLRIDAIEAEREIDRVRIADQDDEIVRLADIIAQLTLQPAVAGTLPPRNEIDMLMVQIFRATDLSLNDKKGGRTEWSLKIEPYHRGHRQKGVNINLLPPTKARDIAIERQTPPLTMALIESVCENSSALVGIVKRRTAGGGRPFVTSQVAFMDGHESGMDDVRVHVMIDDEAIKIESFRPAAGTRKGAALWFGSVTL